MKRAKGLVGYHFFKWMTGLPSHLPPKPRTSVIMLLLASFIPLQVVMTYPQYNGSICVKSSYLPFATDNIDYMAPVVRAEPNGPEIIEAYYDISKLFQRVGWANCIQAFKGHNIIVVRAFAQSFNGKRAKVGDVEQQLVNETFIAEATGLSLKGRVISQGLEMV
jgi:hypothetical protein